MVDPSQQTLDLFAQIGVLLKSAREQRGYSLRELSSHTRINLSFLEKIEAGDLKGLPGIAFVKGFIRNYISVLEIKSEELEDALRRLAPPGGREAAAQLTPSNPQVLDTEAPRASYFKIGLFGVLAVLILWVGYVLFHGSGPREQALQPLPSAVLPAGQAGGVGATGPAPVGPALAPAVIAPPVAPPASGAPPAAAPGGTASPPQGSAKPPPRASAARTPASSRAGASLDGRQKLELTIRGLERTWVRLSLDRAPPVDVLMQPAETVAWEAEQEIRLTIGRSNGVAVYLNGEEVLLPSEPNKLIPNLVLNKLTLLRLEN